ncbi:MAG: type II toxin-antitoxin system RelE/ParE family toxin [Patescibacteria group bacterium]
MHAIKEKMPAKEITFVLLHGFIKKGDKTPKNEIETAEKRLKDYIARYS